MSMPILETQEVAAVVAPSSPSILIVEDEAMIASYIEHVLGESGYDIAGVASSGPEALSLALETRPALALVDIRLTGPIDGIEVACRLRRDFGIPSIFLSGMATPETERRAAAAEPLGFLHKPFLPSQVFKAIQRALATLPGTPAI
jgi:two-component system, response regulator PdtaR